MWASVFHTFCPLTIHSSPSLIARVARPAKSEPGARFGEQLAPHLLAREHRAQEAVADLVTAVGDDRRSGEGHEERGRVGRLGTGRPDPLFDELVQFRPHAEATEALGEVHPGQPGVVSGAAERRRCRSPSDRWRRGAHRAPLRPSGSRDRCFPADGRVSVIVMRPACQTPPPTPKPAPTEPPRAGQLPVNPRLRRGFLRHRAREIATQTGSWGGLTGRRARRRTRSGRTGRGRRSSRRCRRA